MTQKDTENAVRELQKLVSELTAQVVSMQAAIIEQKELIAKHLRQNNVLMEQLKKAVEGKPIETSTTSAQPVLQRPIRQVRLTATSSASANYANATKKNAANPSNGGKRTSMTSGTSNSTTTVPDPAPAANRHEPKPFLRSTVENASRNQGTATKLPMTSAVAAEHDIEASPSQTEKDEWTKVIKRSHKRQIITGLGSDDNELQTVERMKYIQVWSLRPETTVQNVLNYVNKIDKCDEYVVEKRQIKTDRHAAFVIGCPERLYEQLSSPTSWPQRVKLSDWNMRFPREPRAARGSETGSGSRTEPRRAGADCTSAARGTSV